MTGALTLASTPRRRRSVLLRQRSVRILLLSLWSPLPIFAVPQNSKDSYHPECTKRQRHVCSVSHVARIHCPSVGGHDAPDKSCSDFALPFPPQVCLPPAASSEQPPLFHFPFRGKWADVFHGIPSHQIAFIVSSSRHKSSG
jgi:hypothetical protein